MRNILIKYAPEAILLIFLILFFTLKKPYESWDRVINSDGKAYYGYLTAIFIYGDLDYHFVEDYEQKYYPADGSAFKEFRYDFRGEIVNKGFPGLALLWLPFFLVAHLLTLLLGFPPDGYSIIYQYAIGLSALFYLWLGFKFLIHLLIRFQATDQQAAFIGLIIAFGTNIIYYAIVEPSMGHIYSFALLTGFLLFTLKAFHEPRIRWYVLATVFFSILLIMRPTNMIFILLVFFLAGNFTGLKKQLRIFITNPKTLFYTLLSAFIILIIPLLLWKVQTGYFFVYSYGVEGFNFGHPQILKVLFSYNRGWFLYTPVALISLFGFFRLFKINAFQGSVLLILLVIHIYITSSWWVWHYASKFSQRVFIDMYAIIVLLLLFLFQGLNSQKILRYSIKALIIILVFFNLFQFYQQYKWVFPNDYITGKIYWDSFGKLTRTATFNIPENAIVNDIHVIHDFEQSKGWANENTMVVKDRSGVSEVNGSNEYSVEYSDLLHNKFANENKLIVVSASIMTQFQKTDAALIVEFQSFGRTYSYNPFYLDAFNKPDRWVKVEFAILPPDETLTASDNVKVIFYNKATGNTLYIDNLSIDFYSLSEDPKKFENVRRPVYNYKRMSSLVNTFGDKKEQIFTGSITREMAYNSKYSAKVDADHPFSPGFDLLLSDYKAGRANILILHAWVFSQDSVKETRLIADFISDEKSYGYFPFFIRNKVEPSQWSLVEYLMEIPEFKSSDDRLKVYFWNPSATEKVYIDDLQIDFIELK
ncbi:MAG: hypothetical protein JW731_11735 [Bacteroidales bacterium]|nr:hypothetical protein [Bacteroidales bacterium]